MSATGTTPSRAMPNMLYETTAEIVALSNRTHPRVLYLGTATYDEPSAMDDQTKGFAARGCPVASLSVAWLTPPRSELVPFEIVCPDAAFAEAHLLAAHASNHRWYIYPHMADDECLLFVTGDTAGHWPAAPHTSVDDPRTTAHDPPRNSIEARVFVIFDA